MIAIGHYFPISEVAKVALTFSLSDPATATGLVSSKQPRDKVFVVCCVIHSVLTLFLVNHISLIYMNAFITFSDFVSFIIHHPYDKTMITFDVRFDV